MRDSTSAGRRTRPWGALAGLFLTVTFVVLSTGRTWTLTQGAALDWRIRILLPDALVGGLLALGFAVAAFGAGHWRRVGWGLVSAVVLGVIGWTLYAINA